MERLNKWLGLVANFGVVVGIVFLAYEMRLNTDAMQSSTSAQMVTNWNSITLEGATNRDLVEAQIDVSNRGLEVAAEDLPAFYMAMYFASSNYKATEFSFLEAMRGNMEEEAWVSQLSANRQYISGNLFMLFSWRFMRNSVTASFREFMDDMIRDICANQTCPEGGRPEDWSTVLMIGGPDD